MRLLETHLRRSLVGNVGRLAEAPIDEGTEMSKNERPAVRTAFRELFRGRYLGLGFVALLSALGGLAEAAFLVLITNAAISLAEAGNDVLEVGSVSLSTVQVALVSFVFVVLRVAFGVGAAWKSAALTSSVAAQMRREMASDYIRASWSLQHDERSGRLQDLLTTFTARGSSLATSVTSLARASFSLLALLATAVFVDLASSGAVIVLVLVLGLLLRPLRAAVRRRARRSSEAGIEFASGLSELSSLTLEMHIFGTHDAVLDRIDRLVGRAERLNRRLNALKGSLPVIYVGLAYSALVGAVATIGVVEGADIAALGVIVLLMLRSLNYGQAIQVSLGEISASSPFLITYRKELERFRASRSKFRSRPVERMGNISLDDVSFEYMPGAPVLEHINAVIQEREVVGIIGPSGSGKSTLVQLLLGLRAPTSGHVSVAAGPIAELDRSDLVRRVTFVPQEAQLLAGTVKENIRFMRDWVSDEDIIDASKRANLHGDIEAFTEGYERFVGERGGNLSGGQQQRLVIARALVERPEVLILDEPTSALDVSSEHLIRETLNDLRSTTTVVIVAHRMSTLEICDRIMVIESGRLVGFDRPEKLKEGSDFYRRAIALSGIA